MTQPVEPSIDQFRASIGTYVIELAILACFRPEDQILEAIPIDARFVLYFEEEIKNLLTDDHKIADGSRVCTGDMFIYLCSTNQLF